MNAAGTAQHINIQINGAKKISRKGEAVVLSASKLDDTNSITEPNKFIPRMEKVDDLGDNFTREFPAYSVTVLKLQSR